MPDKKPEFDPALVLKDRKNFPDDLEIPLGNGAVMTLGAFREYDTATQGSVQAELEKGRKALDAERQKVEAASNSVAQMYVELQKQQATLEAQPPAARPPAKVDALDEVLETDPVYTRLRKDMAQWESKFGALDKKIDDGFGRINSTLNEVGSTYLTERYQRDYDDIMATQDEARPKDLSLEQLYRYASDGGFKKRNGIIDMRRAYDQMTQPKRTELAIAKARDEGRAEAIKERDRNAMLPKPGYGPPIPGLDKIIGGQQAPKNLEEAFAAAANDREMWINPQS
jgi:hypothetical protein